MESNDYENYFRMDSETYQELLNLVSRYIAKNTNMREASLPPERRVACLKILRCKISNINFPNNN